MGRQGTGLGLATVYGVVKDLHGYIDVRTQPGKGTEFSVYLPVSDAAQPAPSPSPNMVRTGSETVLVVDDTQEQRELATRLLSRLGYKVSSAVNGRAAIDFLKHNPVDLVVLDMIMDDDLDGLDTFREIRKLEPAPRCIIASGYAETERVREAQSLGVGDYIRKPYTMDKIAEAVRQELDRSAAPV
jgi:CheY-like chemotaxis protein